MFDHAELPKALLTINQWTYRYGVSRATLYKLMKDSQISYVKIGKRTLIPEAASEQWLASLSRSSTSSAA